MLDAVPALVATVDPDVPVTSLLPMTALDYLNEPVASLAVLSASFAIAAALLVAVGLYGVLATLFALFAEVERDLISERTREGLARARSSGRKLGRPKGSLGVSRLDGKQDEIRRFLELGVSKTAIAKITGVSRTALYSFMTTRGLRPSR